MDDIFEVIDRVMTENGIRPTVRYTYGYRTAEWDEISSEQYEDGPGIVLPSIGDSMSEYEREVLNLQPLTDEEVLSQAISNPGCNSPKHKRSSLLSRYSYDDRDKERTF